MPVIYKITNIKNGKSYIGKSENTFEERYQAGRWFESTQNPGLRRDLDLHGKSSFIAEILCDTSCHATLLLALESFFITELNTLEPHGYNVSLSSISTIEYYRRQVRKLEDELWRYKRAAKRYIENRVRDAVFTDECHQDQFVQPRWKHIRDIKRSLEPLFAD